MAIPLFISNFQLIHLYGCYIFISLGFFLLKQIQTRFKNWVSAKENGGKRIEETAFDDNMSICSGAESELARLVTPEQPVAEDEFDDLAEKIACKVKNDLGLSRSLSSSQPTNSTEITEIVNSEHQSWGSEKCQTFTRDVPVFNHLGTSGLACHNCAICKKIMVSLLYKQEKFITV